MLERNAYGANCEACDIWIIPYAGLLIFGEAISQLINRIRKDD